MNPKYIKQPQTKVQKKLVSTNKAPENRKRKKKSIKMLTYSVCKKGIFFVSTGYAVN